LSDKLAEMGGFNEKGKYSKTQMYYVRTVRSLEEYYLYESFFRRKNVPEKINWPVQFKIPVESFISQLAINGNSSQNINRYINNIRELITYLNKYEVDSLDSVTSTHISKYISSLIGYAPRTIQTKISVLRVFLKYLYLNEFIGTALWSCLPKVQGVCRTKIPTVWSQDEIQKILNVIDMGNPTGKRDYAIILLVSKTGLRCGDVINLKFSDIDWDKHEINITQGKTKNTLTLPLLPDVGWAIIDYLKNGRPTTSSQNVFVRHLAPFEGMSNASALYGRITKYIWQAGIPVEHKERIGMHSLRHSLASTLLQNNVELNIISNILGQEDPETTRHYLNVNLEALRQCPIIIAGGETDE
jgi:site-specific recombinase XerD